MEFTALWRMHGGSGLGITRTEYLDLEVDYRDRLLERIADQRETEAAAIKAAAEGK